ncbi:MAG: acetyltransferase [Leptothrix sp. (in: b-proteobacteria)]
MSTTPIVIFGAGGFGREVLQLIHDINRSSPSGPIWQPLGFVVDPEYVDDRLNNGLPIVGSPCWLETRPDVHVVLAVGAPAVRLRTVNDWKQVAASRYATLVHPRAWVGDHVAIGAGSIICAGALITTNISIGQHVHVNIGCTIGHDAVLDDFVTLNPSVNVSGNVHLGTGVDVGTRSVLIPHADVGEWSILGAGSVATKPLPSNVTAVGSPAKVIKTRDEGWHR